MAMTIIMSPSMEMMHPVIGLFCVVIMSVFSLLCASMVDGVLFRFCVVNPRQRTSQKGDEQTDEHKSGEKRRNRQRQHDEWASSVAEMTIFRQKYTPKIVPRVFSLASLWLPSDWFSSFSLSLSISFSLSIDLFNEKTTRDNNKTRTDTQASKQASKTDRQASRARNQTTNSEEGKTTKVETKKKQSINQSISQRRKE